MADKTKIQWADSCVNFWWGCRRVSPGCENCYIAQSTPFRANHMKHGSDRRKSKSAVKDALKFNRQPLICDECGGANDLESCEEDTLLCQHCCESTMNYHTRRIFSLSLGDWLDEEVPIEWLAEMLNMIRKCDQVIWILCTKRPENFFSRLGKVRKLWACDGSYNITDEAKTYHWLCHWMELYNCFPINVCILTSVENQAMADKRIPELLKIPARWHGLSCEPILSAVDLSKWIPKISWQIIGAESGPHARPCNIDWIRSLVEQGRAAGIATFCKQLGAHCVTDKATPDGWPVGTGLSLPVADQRIVKLRDKKGGEMSEWPKDLRVREFPKGF